MIAARLAGFMAGLKPGVHSDGNHPHLHLIVDVVHPDTGKASKLSYSRIKLSKWAENYERERRRFIATKGLRTTRSAPRAGRSSTASRNLTSRPESPSSITACLKAVGAITLHAEIQVLGRASALCEPQLHRHAAFEVEVIVAQYAFPECSFQNTTERKKGNPPAQALLVMTRLAPSRRHLLPAF